MSKLPKNYGVPSPDVEWREKGEIFSVTFSDRYFSRAGGLEESEYVFLEGNNLPGGWKEKPCFVIAELGFGSGLNFLLSCRRWKESRSPGARLHFISFEGFPLNRDQLLKALSAWPELKQEANALLERLPFLAYGFHRVDFPDEVTLTLALGDVSETLPELSASVDAWFLDGFAPANNPSMWSKNIFAEMARVSHPGTTVSSFTAASNVRRGLEEYGFRVAKRVGFARKREMITAEFAGLGVDRRRPPGTVTVVGGGLAGTAVAYSFARRGWSVKLIERESDIAKRASGNAAGVLMPHLSIKPDALGRIGLLGYEYALQELAELRRLGAVIRGNSCGVLRLASSDRLKRLTDEIQNLGLGAEIVRSVSAAEGSELTGFSVSERGLFFPHGGWVNPPDICAAYLELSGGRVQRFMNCELGAASFEDGVWQLSDTSGKAVCKSEIVVLATAYDCTKDRHCNWFPLESVRGQAVSVTATEQSRKLKTVVCYDGYISPEAAGRHFLGATFEHENCSEAVNTEESKELFDRFEAWLPDFPLAYAGDEIGRVGFRTMSRDRVPFVGRVPDIARFEAVYRSEGITHADAQAIHPGLYVSVGHGSRGLSSCSLAAEIIAAEVSGEPAPLEAYLLSELRPSRFLIRMLQREMSLTPENLDDLKVPHLRRIRG